MRPGLLAELDVWLYRLALVVAIAAGVTWLWQEWL